MNLLMGRVAHGDPKTTLIIYSYTIENMKEHLTNKSDCLDL